MQRSANLFLPNRPAPENELKLDSCVLNLTGGLE